jgi:hypothetical protein
MAELDGDWVVERVAGLLPPMAGVRKRIDGERGVTVVARLLRLPFAVEGRSLRYRFPPGLVDELEPDADGFRGRALVFGRELGRFRIERPSATRDG